MKVRPLLEGFCSSSDSGVVVKNGGNEVHFRRGGAFVVVVVVVADKAGGGNRRDWRRQARQWLARGVDWQGEPGKVRRADGVGGGGGDIKTRRERATLAQRMAMGMGMCLGVRVGGVSGMDERHEVLKTPCELFQLHLSF
ncbi:MAG: hypothetical protein J0L63_18415 [Anaerolineae bacterium]|nr:hypothetical protein [Anaerolineae bacterium]